MADKPISIHGFVILPEKRDKPPRAFYRIIGTIDNGYHVLQGYGHSHPDEVIPVVITQKEHSLSEPDQTFASGDCVILDMKKASQNEGAFRVLGSPAYVPCIIGEYFDYGPYRTLYRLVGVPKYCSADCLIPATYEELKGG